jgi:hypothetical protein
VSFRADMRAAGVQLLTDYGADADLRLTVYPGRPRTILPPHAFVDKFQAEITYTGPTNYQHKPTMEMIVLHGIFDSKDAADQADAFADGFLEWQRTRFHAASGNTVIGLVAIEDDPSYVPDWLQPEEQRTYYATRLTLEGLAFGP